MGRPGKLISNCSFVFSMTGCFDPIRKTVYPFSAAMLMNSIIISHPGMGWYFLFPKRRMAHAMPNASGYTRSASRICSARSGSFRARHTLIGFSAIRCLLFRFSMIQPFTVSIISAAVIRVVGNPNILIVFSEEVIGLIFVPVYLNNIIADRKSVNLALFI